MTCSKAHSHAEKLCWACASSMHALHRAAGATASAPRPHARCFVTSVRRLHGCSKSEIAGVRSHKVESAPDGLCLEVQSPEQVTAKWLWQQLAGPLKAQPCQNTRTSSASTTWVMSLGHRFPCLLKGPAAKLVGNGTIGWVERRVTAEASSLADQAYDEPKRMSAPNA